MPLREFFRWCEQTRPSWLVRLRARIVWRVRWTLWTLRKHRECAKDKFVVCPALSKMIHDSAVWAERVKAMEVEIGKMHLVMMSLRQNRGFDQRRIATLQATIEAVQRFNREG